MVNGITKLRHVAILTVPNSLCISMRCIAEKSMTQNSDIIKAELHIYIVFDYCAIMFS